MKSLTGFKVASTGFHRTFTQYFELRNNLYKDFEVTLKAVLHCLMIPFNLDRVDHHYQWQLAQDFAKILKLEFSLQNFVKISWLICCKINWLIEIFEGIITSVVHSSFFYGKLFNSQHHFSDPQSSYLSPSLTDELWSFSPIQY